jgi:5-methylcytosine-specific restriction endonuclease McrA
MAKRKQANGRLRKWRAEHKEHCSEWWRKYRETGKPREAMRKYQASEKGKAVRAKYRFTPKYRETARKNWRDRERKLRQEVLERFGAKCAICGYDGDIRALEIDHINNNGNIERKKMRHSEILKRALEHSEEYQLLCANCNRIKEYGELIVYA